MVVFFDTRTFRFLIETIGAEYPCVVLLTLSFTQKGRPVPRAAFLFLAGHLRRTPTEDLVDANYLRTVPVDPMTHRPDWVVEFGDVQLPPGSVAKGIKRRSFRSSKRLRKQLPTALAERILLCGSIKKGDSEGIGRKKGGIAKFAPNPTMLGWTSVS